MEKYIIMTYLRFKTELEHSIGLVKYQERDALKIGSIALDVVNYATRGGYHYFRAFF